MRIAVWHNLPFGGGARALNYHLNGLLDLGHSIEVWSPDPSAGGIIKLPRWVKVHRKPLSRTEHVPYMDRLSAVFFGKDENMRQMEAHSMQCAAEINAGNFDLFFANCCFYYAAPFISRYVSTPTILYLGEPRRFYYEAHPKSFWEPPVQLGGLRIINRRFWWEWLKDWWKISSARVQVREERLNICAVDKLLVNSVFSSESCARAYDRTGEVCYLGVDTGLFRPLPEKRIQHYVMGLGSLFFHKGAELAIRAVGDIPARDRPALVWVSNITDPLHKERMQQLAKLMAVNFIVKEKISDESLVSLLNNAICLLYTSKLEPFGFAPLEANACATPVIGLMQGGIRETVLDGRTGFLVLPDAQAIADKLQYFIQNPDVREEMGKLSLANVQKNWSLKAATLRLEGAMRDTLKPAKTPLNHASESNPPARRTPQAALAD